MTQMNGMDSAFLQMETPTMHLHVVGVLVLDPSNAPEGWSVDRVLEIFGLRLHLIPPFRQRLVTVPGGLDRPRWIEDANFDLGHHIRRVTIGPAATPNDLEHFVSDVASHPLGRDRPLWQAWVVDGFQDGSVAVVTKIHHAIMDGAAGGDLMASLFDLSPEAAEPAGGDDDWQGEPDPNTLALLVDSATNGVSRALRLPATLARTASGLFGTARERLDQRAAGVSPRLFAPSSPFNGSLTPARSVAFARCPIVDVKHVRSVFATTVNDVVLAATTAALRSYLIDHDALPDRALIASVPVSLRVKGSALDCSNRTSNLMVPLPVHLEDPVERLQSIHEWATAAKAVHRAGNPDLLEDWAALAPVHLLQLGAAAYTGLGLARLHPPLFNAVVSNVAGPPVPMFLAGARVVAIYPMGPLIGGTALDVTVLSHTDDLNIGVIACPDLVDDVSSIALGIVRGVEELDAAAFSAEPAAPRPPSGKV